MQRLPHRIRYGRPTTCSRWETGLAFKVDSPGRGTVVFSSVVRSRETPRVLVGDASPMCGSRCRRGCSCCLRKAVSKRRRKTMSSKFRLDPASWIYDLQYVRSGCSPFLRLHSAVTTARGFVPLVARTATPARAIVRRLLMSVGMACATRAPRSPDNFSVSNVQVRDLWLYQSAVLRSAASVPATLTRPRPRSSYSRARNAGR